VRAGVGRGPNEVRSRRHQRLVEQDDRGPQVLAALVLDPKDERRDNVRIGIWGDDGERVHHHLRAYEVMRSIRALEDALAFGPAIPDD
jgi:hypothetical protein